MFDEYRFSGSLPEEATTYVTREADRELYEGLTAGKFCYVLNSRQSGKSSLRVRTMRRLRDNGVECAAIDLSAGGIQNVPPEQWYADLIDTLIDSFGLDLDFGDWWSENQLNSLVTRFRKFLEEILLAEIQENIVIFIDEIDSVLSLNFPTDDFFAFIRSCYNQRVDNSNYNRLTFCLLGVASPSNLIEDKKRTPFNIGQAISLKGFQLHEVEPLEKGLRLRSPDSHGVMKDILHWTGGQPFLTQKLCQFMVEESFQDNPRNVEQVVRSRIIENWESQDEPEHLRTIRDRILRDEQRAGYLLELYQQIRHSEEQAEITADDTLEQSELQLSGLVVRQQNKLKVYNPIYREIFDSYWIETQLRSLRPYSESFRFWVASGGKDESRLLRGKALQDALKWADDKSLNYQDREFLAASQAKEKEEAIAALEKEAQLERQRKDKEAVEKRNLVLSEANKKAQRRMSIGTAVLILTLSVAVISAVLATAAGNKALQAQNRVDDANKKVSEAEGKFQVAEQNLGTTNQKLLEAQKKAKTAQKSEKDARQKLEEAKQQEKKAQENEKSAQQREKEAKQSAKDAKFQEKQAQKSQQIAQQKEKEANKATKRVQQDFKQTQKELKTNKQYLQTVGELAKLAGELKDKGFYDEAKELLSQAGQSVNIEDDNLKQDILHTGIAYANLKLQDPNWETEVENSLGKVNKKNDNSLESLQIQILIYKTQGNFQKEKQKNTDAMNSYKKAFNFLKDLKKKTSSISPTFNESIPTDEKILSKEVVEALHREFINLLDDKNNEKKLKQEVEDSLKEHLYNELANLLKNKQFKQADGKTDDLMLYIARRENERYLNEESINKFSCPDLRRIDRFWVENSQGRFGFSVQKKILTQTLGIRDLKNISDKEYLRFVTTVGWYNEKKTEEAKEVQSSGWLNYSELNFTENAVGGHLPYMGVGGNAEFIFSRAATIFSRAATILSRCDLSTVTYKRSS